MPQGKEILLVCLKARHATVSLLRLLTYGITYVVCLAYLTTEQGVLAVYCAGDALQSYMRQYVRQRVGVRFSHRSVTRRLTTVCIHLMSKLSQKRDRIATEHDINTLLEAL